MIQSLSIVQVLGRNISLGAPFRTGLVAGWVWGMERCMWAKNRAQQNSPLKLWERNLEVSIIEEESGRWRGTVFSPCALSHLNGINYFSMMILKARSPSFQCLPNSSTWKVQLYFILGMCPHPSALLLLGSFLSHFWWWSTTFLVARVQYLGAILHFSVHAPDLVSHSALVFLSLPSLFYLCYYSPHPDLSTDGTVK